MKNALANGIMKAATNNGEKKLHQLFGCFGFNTVLIEK